MNWVFYFIIFLIAFLIWILIAKGFPAIGSAIFKMKDRVQKGMEDPAEDQKEKDKQNE